MARRSEHSQEEIRKMVLNAAQDIVINEGFSALNARKIAAKVGYTVGSIYMVFVNMAELTLHIKARTLDDIALLLEQVNDLNAAQNIEELAKAYLRFASRNFNRWIMIFEDPLPRNSMACEWYQLKVDHVFSLVENQFNRLTPNYPDSQKKRATRALWAGVHGICSLSLSGNLDFVSVDDVEESVVLLVRSFIQGWVTAV
jgi:AcrR family transcriptional regulator